MNAKPTKLLDLQTMQYIHEDRPSKVTRTVGRKNLMVTRRGAELLHRRLLMGEQTLFDIIICELVRANVAMRDSLPLAGSRAHYSFVEGGKPQGEEMATRGWVYK